MKEPEKYKKLQSGYSEIDKLVGGFSKEDLIMIPARPGIGKTTFVLNLLFNQCVVEDNICLFFSLEMPHTQIIPRMLCIKYGYKFVDLRDEKPDALFWEAFKEKNLTSPFKNIFFESPTSCSVEEVSRIIKVFIKKFPACQAVYIDYLNLLSTEAVEKNAPKHEKIGYVSYELKKIAQFHKIPVIALCQGKRDLDKSKKNPTMSDVKDSSNIEANADTMLFMTKGGTARELNRQELFLHPLKTRHGVGGTEILLKLNTENLRIEGRSLNEGGYWNFNSH